MAERFIPQRIYKKKDLPAITGLSLTTIWRMQKAGEFPQNVQLSPGRVGVLTSLVDAWIESRQPVA